MRIDFVGHVERMLEHWKELLHRRASGLMHQTVGDITWRVYTRPAGSAAHDLLSPAMRCAFCRSRRYGHDAYLFGYANTCRGCGCPQPGYDCLDLDVKVRLRDNASSCGTWEVP